MTIAFDVIVILMLGATIFYAATLNKKLSALRNQKEEMAANLEAFSKATDAAIAAVEDLNARGELICKNIEQRVKHGQVLADDIEFLVERATKRLKEFEAKEKHAQKQGAGNSSQIAGYSESELVKLLSKKQKESAIAG